MSERHPQKGFFSLPRAWLGKKVKGGVVGSRGGSIVTFALTPHSLKKKKNLLCIVVFSLRFYAPFLFALVVVVCTIARSLQQALAV